MRLSKFLLIVTLLTVVALVYVYQQVELLKINYCLNRNRDNLSVLLDHNSALMYNVDYLQSPVYLEQQLNGQKKATWEVPLPWYKIGLAEAAR